MSLLYLGIADLLADSPKTNDEWLKLPEVMRALSIGS